MKIYGLVGPVNQIISFITNYGCKRREISTENNQSRKLRLSGQHGEINLENLAEVEKTSVYLIKM